MALAYVFSGARPRAIRRANPGAMLGAFPGVYGDVLADATVKSVYFSLVATAFVFASIILTGVHP